MTKFITEEHLKGLYKKESFNSFELKINERLTPGGRQYLLDKKILIIDNLNLKISDKCTDRAGIKEKIESDTKEEKKCKENLKNQNLIYKFNSIESLFYKLASDVFIKDLELAQKIIDICRYIRNFREFLEGKTELININCKVETEDQKEEVEISEIYIYTKNSSDLFAIQHLFYELKILKNLIVEVYEKEKHTLEITTKYIDVIIEIMSKLISETAGGMKCQMKK
ncbi:MAG: hypothetical protein ACRCXY_06990 [Fusobacteriaceae bacterium]